MTVPQDYLDEMVRNYVGAGLWSETHSDTDEDTPEPLDDLGYTPDDMAETAMVEIYADVHDFAVEVWPILEELGMDAGQAGYDFLLTRNRHGAGFWDRGLGEAGEKLTEAAHAWGETNFYPGDNNLIYVS